MAKLTLGDWEIASDNHGWVLGKPKTIKVRGKDYTRYNEPTYYPNLSQALKGLVERDVRESDLNGVEEVQKRLAELDKAIGGLLA